MVFEHLFPDELLERKEWTAFTLAIIYSTISILIARFLFPANSGIASIIFVSIFLLPYFQTLLRREERQERKEKTQSFRKLLSDNTDIVKTYFFLFFGIYLTFMAYAFIATRAGVDVGSVFREQLSLGSMHGNATFSGTLFFNIFLNNWWVLLATFLIALIAGDGAIFFVAWNASTWGTIFGYRAVEASLASKESALLILLIIALITLPHVLLEATAYIFAAIAGGVLSDEVVQKSRQVKRFVLYFLCAAVGFVLLRKALGLLLSGPVYGFATVLVALGLLHVMLYLFTSERDRAVFRYNFYLFALAVGIFLLAALIETLVLLNAEPLHAIYTAAA